MSKKAPLTPSQELNETVLELEEQYMARWGVEQNEWNRHGVYTKAAEMIGHIRNGIHVDLGAGLGRFVAGVFTHNPQRHVIGVDNNHVAIRASLAGMKELGIPVQGAGARSHFYDSDTDMVHHEIHAFEEYLPGFVSAGNPEQVTFLLDDIRELRNLKSFVKGRKVDSGSFLFPGTGSYLFIRAPFKLQNICDEATRSAQACAVMQETRRAAYRYMSENMKTGGSFLMAERVVKSELQGTGEVIDIARSQMEKMLGSYFSYWKHGQTCLPDADLSTFSAPLPWVVRPLGDSAQALAISPEEVRKEVAVVIHEFVRSELPFVPEAA